MNLILLVFTFLLSGFYPSMELEEINTLEKENSIEVKVVNFEQLEPLLCPADNEDITYVINFFATWCKPCVDELPYFLELHANHREEGLHFILISLDFPQQLESRLIPFLKNNKVTAEVFLLDDPAANTWIPKVDESWSGAIPATVICRAGKNAFYEKTFHSTKELTEIVAPFLNP